MKKSPLKQGTLKWEMERASRIGSSEIFDIVKYYSTDEELQNCGINAEDFRAEAPYTTAWALYHKMLNDGIYQKESLPPSQAEYGHAVEVYGFSVLQQGRERKLRRGEVFTSNRLIASLDISGISEEIDQRPFDYGGGMVPTGKSFVCEQKSILPSKLKKGLPMKHIIQAQYQITMTKADFYILQLMVLKEDTDFERGKITQMSNKKRCEYLKDKMTVTHLYFQNNEHMAMLIKACIERFFADVDNRNEPTPYIAHDSQRNVIESIRLNSAYNKDMIIKYELGEYINVKSEGDTVESARKSILQNIIETAKENNACIFISKDGTIGKFSKDGKFLITIPKEA